MNNYFNFTIPEFNEQNGSDWDFFSSIMEDATDNLMSKTFQLYWLFDPNYFSTRVAEKVMDSLDLDYTASTTLELKKHGIRTFLTKYSQKGLQDTYLDVQETIVGTRGAIYSGTVDGWRSHTTDVNNVNRWGSAAATFPGAFKWNVAAPQFYIYIDAKTIDSALLDLLVEEYRKPSLLPAFYQIYIVDSLGNLLRTV